MMLACFALAGCNIVNQVRLRVANNDLVPKWQDSQIKAELIAYYVGEKPYVEISLNATKGFKFLVDTGASITILFNSDKIKSLNLEQGYALPIAGWGDEEDSSAYQTKLENLMLGNAKFEDVIAAYIPINKTKYFSRPDELTFDGVLGHDILRHFSWTFDKKNNQISISRDAYQPSGNEVSIEFDRFFKKIDIEAKSDFGLDQTFTQDFIIDTGSRHYVKISNAFVENNEIKVPSGSVTAVDFGMSGRTVHQRITLPSIKLGKLKLSNIKTNIIAGDLDDDFAIVGSALLNQFVSVIDYHSDKLHLTPYPDKKFKTRYNLLGLELRKITSGEFVVRYVFPDVSASKYDLVEGDIITKIDDKLASDISQDDWLDITATPGSYKICRMRVQEKCQAIISKHITGYSTNVGLKAK